MSKVWPLFKNTAIGAFIGSVAMGLSMKSDHKEIPNACDAFRSIHSEVNETLNDRIGKGEFDPDQTETYPMPGPEGKVKIVTCKFTHTATTLVSVENPAPSPGAE